MTNVEKSLTVQIEELIGDMPVSEQLGAALNHMAPKDHVHDNYVTREEYQLLKRQVDLLLGLVGDTSVAEQISVAIQMQGG